MGGHADLIAVADDTLAILERGGYVAPSGRPVALAARAAIAGTRTWTPAELEDLVRRERGARPGPRVSITVTPETTGAASRRLAASGPVLALNFASAVSVGGGFTGGARAQEEDLCRCSALYACLRPQEAYYLANRAARSELYTDHMITSPDVPFFRDEALALLEAPFAASVITAPAPCARRLRDDERALLPSVFERRIPMVLSLAAHLGARRLVLGAWGCGAFRNDPTLVADLFARALAEPGFGGAFEHVTFAVYDPSPGQKNLSAFRARLGSTST